ncbi:MAG: PHP domain-containing protein [Clostridia bacterium]|nr:PHP domain-containing protein [Clostridia bacterium]
MLKEELLKKYNCRIELHAHSMPVSACCSCPGDKFFELYAENNVNAVCLTNHFTQDNPIFRGKTKKESIDAYLEGYEKLKEEAKPYGIDILLGCEIRFNENSNDYLIYGVNREILEEAYDYFGRGVSEYRKNVPLKSSLFIQAHPFRNNMTLIDAGCLDGIETLNFHPNHNSRNSTAAKYAKENGVEICVGGSDFHEDGHYNAAALLALAKRVPTDSFDLAGLLKSKDYLFLLGNNHIIIP